MALDNRIGEIVPLTPLQRGLLFHAVSEAADPYVVQVTARIDGALDPAELHEAWQRLAEHHAALRTGFVIKGQREPLQVTFDGLVVPVEHFDWRGLEPEEVAAAQARVLREDRARGFRLNRPPLLRFAMARIGASAWWVLLSHHHLILDGWSQPILFADLFAILEGMAAGRDVDLPESAGLGEYVAWLRRQDAAATSAFWRERFCDWEPAPLPRPLGAAEDDGALVLERVLDARATRGVESLARAARVTPSTVYQAAWALVLERYVGRRDVTFGVTVSGRTAPLAGIERMVGMLINTLPVRLTIPEGSSLQAWLAAVQTEFRAVEGYAHSDLAELGALAGATPHAPLFETLVAYENFPVAFDAGTASAGLRLSEVRSHERTNLAAALVIVPGPATTIRLQVNTARLAPALAGEMVEMLLSTVARMVEAPEGALSGLDGLATPAPRRRQLERADPDETLVTRFRRVAAAHPARLALAGPGGDLTYRELDQASDRVALALMRRGIATEDRVGLCFERCTQAVVAMLGVVKAGAAYVPVDPLYPDDRIAFTLRDSESALTLASGALCDRLAALGFDALPVEGLAGAEREPGTALPPLEGANAAYAIYTSGSTGQPKGVVVSHASVLRLFDGAALLFAFEPEDVWSVFHSFAFDFSVWEIWGALLHGARALVVPHDVSRDPSAFRALLAREGVTVLSQTPSAFGQLIAADAASATADLALREVILGGEALKPAALEPWFVRHGVRAPRVANMYGITETTVHVTFRPLSAADVALESSPIGSAMPQLDVLLLDEAGRPVPDGVAGEISVAGNGLARGYLGRPALTAERFVPHPWPLVPGERLYRSGDLARRLPGGALEYLGRIDRQVKVRGFRIELGEVEAALCAHPRVARAVVVAYAKDADGHGLCAYVVATEPPAPGEDLGAVLRAHLASRLPAHMVPDAFVPLSRLPLTLNGKIDLDALPDPSESRARATIDELPENDCERAIAQAWAKVLGVERVGVTENYFALGGDSIRSIRIVSLAAEAGVRFSVRQLLEHPTVRELAQAVERCATESTAHADDTPFRLLADGERAFVPASAIDAYPLARMQAGMLFHADADRRLGLYLDLQSFRLAMPLDERALRIALQETADAFPALRTGFVLGEGRRPIQFVLPHADLPLTWIDLRERPVEEREEVVAAYIAGEHGRSYDLERPPLVRVAAHVLEDAVVQLTFSLHHAILDGWSVALWEANFLERYFALRAGLPSPAPAAVPPYSAFVEAELAALDDPATRAFWQAKMAALPPAAVPRWPGDAARGPSEPLHFSREVVTALTRQTHAAGLPLKALLLAIVGHVVCRTAGARAMPIGLVTNGRTESSGGDQAVGLFLNTLPVTLAARGTWRTLAQAALAEEAAILGTRRFPLQELVALGGGAAPFECNFNFVHFHGFRDLSDRLPLTVISGASVEAVDIPFSFNFSSDPNDVGLTFQLLVGDGISAVQRDWMVDAVRRAVEAAAEALDAHAQITNGEMSAAPVEEPDPTQVALDPTPVHLRVLGALVERRDRAVLRDADGRIWSGEALLELVDDLGRRLGARVERGTAVLLWLPRGPMLAAAMLATLRAGGVYVPIDPNAPAGRVSDMLGELSAFGSAPVVLCDETTRALVPGAWQDCVVGADSPVPPASAVAPAVVDADDLAYVIFTSGSTGRPKGVMISHGALANHMGWMAARFPLAPDDVVLQRTSPAFDAAVWEFWAPLIEGALLAFPPESATKDTEELLAAIVASGTTVLQMVPSLLEAVLAHPRVGELPVKRLFCGGEVLRAGVAAEALNVLSPEVINLYGPTEATIDATFHRAEGGGDGAVSIGRPIANMRAYVLDEQLDPVPIGAPGELYLAGAGLARGYVGLPRLTAERFIPDPFAADGARLYRTGDIVRRVTDGALHFLGRVDRQVKLGGNRLELEEVEAVMARHPATQRVAVNAEMRGGQPRLVAYLEGAPDADLVRALQAWLAERLPSYAVPRQFAFVAEWPLLPSGKTNAALLPDRARSVAPARSSGATDLRGPGERAMAHLWEAVLAKPGIGALDDFFALGGDSILALQLAARARRAGFAVGPGDLFRHRTVRALCDAAAAIAPSRAVPPPPAEPVPVTPLQGWFFALDLPRPDHWNQAVLLRCPKDFALDALRANLATLARRHDALRLRFAASGDGWTMQAGTAAIVVDALDVADEVGVSAACRDAQSGLNVAAGPLLRARLLRHHSDREDRLLLVGHHLVVDGVSWRLLLEELAALWTDPDAALDGTPYPFTRWAAARNAQQPDAAEAAFWRDEARKPLAALPLAHESAPLEGRTRTVVRTLDARATASLLGEARERLRCDIPELLLAALGRGLAPLIGERETGVLLERHGRAGVPGLDASQTVGWFTVLHPVRLVPRMRLTAAVRAAKEAIRRVPAGGSNYLVLAARGDGAAPPFPQISLNYLGQFDASLAGVLTPAPEESGPTSDPANRRTTVLDLVALAHGGELRLSANFDAHLLDEDDAASLLGEMTAALEELASLPRGEAVRAWEAQDLPGCALSAAALDRLVAQAPDLEAVYPASPTQQGLLFESRVAGEEGIYVQQVIAEITGPLDPNRLRAAWTEVVARHEALRSSFVDVDERPFQLVHAEVAPALAVTDWAGLSPAEQEMRWSRLQSDERARGFDPAEGPLSRLVLIDLGRGRWRLLWSHHHAIMDGWSLPIVFADLLAAYRTPGALPPPATLAPVVRWRLETDRDALTAQALAELRDLAHPSLLCESVRGTPSAATRELELPQDVVHGLERLTRSAGATMASAVNAAFALVLARYLGVADVVHGVVVSGRSADVAGIDELAGLFIATLPLRTSVRGDRTVVDLIKETQTRLQTLNERAALPLAELQAKVGLGPLFDTIVIFENYPVDVDRLATDGAFNVVEVRTLEQNHYPLSLYVHYDEESLRLALHFDPERIAAPRAEQLLAALGEIFPTWGRGAARHVGATRLLSEGAQRALLARSGGEARAVDAGVDERIASQALATPHATALIAGDRRMTYAEVLARADRIAAALQARGIGSEDRVGVMLPRQTDLPIALLGVLRAGAAFIPLDPGFPEARLAAILEDASPKLLLTAATLSELLDDDASAEATPHAFPAAPLDALAYIIFTSGSTGRPKGVAVSRRALANACAAFRRQPGLRAGDVVAAVTTVSFDIALNELLLPWTAGATVAVIDRDDAVDGVRLAARLSEVAATVLQATPATWRLLLAAGWNGAGQVRSWCGGEALPADLAAEIAMRSVEAWNLYGPTETTIWSSVGRLSSSGPVDAGGPIDNTRLYVVDVDGQLSPPGVAGRLLIGGAGVARGYAGKPGLTAAAFVCDPFSGAPGAVAYDTGDLARWSRDGRLEILGRVDRQIKINGYRVEPGDVEAALRAAPGVKDAACTLRQVTGGPALVAFLVPADGRLDPEAVRRHVQSVLPLYMVPSLLVSLEALPLTANGKVDYKALPEHGLSPRPADEAVAPHDPVENALLLMWQEALGRTDFGVKDDFFEIGGHSLLATRMHARLGRVFQGSVPLRDLFDAPTIELLAERLRAAEAQPGAVTRAAELFVKLRLMKPEEREALRNRAQQARPSRVSLTS